MSKLIFWAIRIVPAIIMLQTLYFKFTAAPEPVHIFSTLMGKYEAYGRIGTGMIELIAGILLVYPKTSVFGAIFGAGTMSGAIISHLFILGIQVSYMNEQNNLINDKGSLFLSALITLTCCAIIIFQQKTFLINFIRQRI
ncbi:MAG: DoxX family protein [Chitinophagales bacterium]|nr:DoxX family protein [Chitinophagales bacterium]